MNETLRVFTCNTNGIRNLKKRKIILNAFKKKKADILSLQETHITNKDFDDWKKGVKGHFFFSPGTHKSNGLVTILDPKFTEAKQIFVKERILIVSCTIEKEDFIIANIYAPSDTDSNKIKFFETLNEAINKIVEPFLQHKSFNFILLGDFNTVLSNKLDIISGGPHHKNTVEKFNEFINKCDLYDSWRNFHPGEKDFTWRRFAQSNARRLDYIFTNDKLTAKIVNSEINSIPMTDHRAVSIDIKFTEFPRGPSYYKFNDSLLKQTAFVSEMKKFIIEKSKSLENLNPHDKWEILKVSIKEKCIELSKQISSKKHDEEAEVEKKLNELERELSQKPNDQQIINDLNNTKLKYDLLSENKRHGSFIRSKCKHIEEGERNTKYFFSLEKIRKQQTTITSLETQNGKVTDKFAISKEIHRFYTELYSNKSTHDLDKLQNFHKDLVIPNLSEDELNFCETPITVEEIGKSLSKLNNSSSPGLDSLTTSFYKVFWLQLKDDLYKSFTYSHEIGQLTNTQTKGVTTLLHKGKELNRENLDHFRPISVVNLDYKILAKTIAERLKIILPSIISKTQYGFMKGRNPASILRQIDDILQYAEDHKKIGYMLAIDFKKCFDSVSHKYVKYAFQLFGFGNYFSHWIQTIITKGQNCVNNGGWLTNYFNLEQGLKQGCPAAPLIYLVIAELLSLNIKQNSKIKGIHLDNKIDILKILQYADDTTLFFRDLIDFREILSKIKEFEVFSGLQINPGKSKIMPISTYAENLTQTNGIEQVREVKILGVIFKTGIPTMKVEQNWLNIMEKIDRHIKSWSRRDLSIQGKIIVAKTFLISNCIYMIQSISLPDEIINKINRKIFTFIWKKRASNKKAFEKIKRSIMCLDEEYGGLRMINLKQMQDSFLIHWVVKLIKSPTNPDNQIPPLFFKKWMACISSNRITIHR